jgi:serine/threonine protein phosphatase PrpC
MPPRPNDTKKPTSASPAEVVHYGHATHVGLVRDHNEDDYRALPTIGLWLVADGMGGHQAGEVASAIVGDRVSQEVLKGNSLQDAIRAAHRAVIDSARCGQGSPGMGSTVVALRLLGHNYEIAWVGDSRAYLWNGTLKQLTRDHSFVQELVDGGAITAEEARNHPHRNVITRAIGHAGLDGSQNKDPLLVDLVSGDLHPKDQVLLCSDGLSGEVSDEEIGKILHQDAEAQDKVDQLIRAALDHGGSDNVTVLLVGL